MRRGFSLIEMMVVVMIISVVLVAVLKLSRDSFVISQNLEKRTTIFLPLTTVALHATKDRSNTSFSLLNLLEKEYKIESDKVKSYLSNYQILYKQDEVDLINLIPEGIESSVSPQIRTIEHQITHGEQRSRIYTIKMEQ